MVIIMGVLQFACDQRLCKMGNRILFISAWVAVFNYSTVVTYQVLQLILIKAQKSPNLECSSDLGGNNQSLDHVIIELNVVNATVNIVFKRVILFNSALVTNCRTVFSYQITVVQLLQFGVFKWLGMAIMSLPRTTVSNLIT